MDLHEGEIVLKEQYGSSAIERYYVKPSDQFSVVVHKVEKYSNISGIFTKIFLPQGYPSSVSKDYLHYQIWDTAQAFCSTIAGTLATQEVLRGVGVGDVTATPLAATVTWVLKDGCGHLGRIIFAYSHGSFLDSYSKKWRLVADTLNDAAMCIEIALPLFRNYTTLALCVSTVMKAIVGVAGGATRTAMTSHHSLRGNKADLAAKDSAQETAVNLVASFFTLFIISVFGNSLYIFFLMLVLHVVFNYLAVRAVCLRTFNEPRLLLLIDSYLDKEVIPSPCEVNRIEPIVFYQLGSNVLDVKICGFQIKIGHSLSQMTQHTSMAMYIKKITEIYFNKNHILYPNTSQRIMYVFLKEGCSSEDVLYAYFHAVLLSIIVCAINDEPLPMLQGTPRLEEKPFAWVCATLRAAQWSRVRVSRPAPGALAHAPTAELLRYVHQMARQEWEVVRDGLLRTGWDLSRHLLITDEWRICGEKKMADETIPPHNVKSRSTMGAKSVQAFKDTMDEKDLDELVDRDTYTIEPESSERLIKAKGRSCLNI